MSVLMNFVNLLIVPGAVLLLPIAVTLWFRWASLRADEPEQRLIWAGYRKFGRFILVATVAVWWVIWDLAGRSTLVSIFVRTWPRAPEISSVASWRFWLPPIVSLGIFLFLCSEVDKTVLRLKWTAADSLRQAWWKLVSFVIPLLMVAAGFGFILDKKLGGIAWLLVAGVASKIGTGFLIRAEGMKFNTLKSGEYRNRALRVARGMGVTLRRVFVVPAGKGHLTNAYGMSNAIAVTDNLGQYLNDGQIEFVIAHEVAHVRLKHVRIHLLLVVTIFSITALSLFFFPLQTKHFRPLFQLVAIFGPLIALYYCSRRFEYSADREAIEFTDAPEIAVRALAKLHQVRELPAASDAFTELFMTHPTFAHRVGAIVNDGQIPADRLPHILEAAGMAVIAPHNQREERNIP
jgi:Zn-dependent protease with chaperone function